MLGNLSFMKFSLATLLFVTFFVIVARQFFLAGLFQLWFYKLRKNKWMTRRLGKKDLSQTQFLREIKWSLITSFIFAVVGVLTYILWQNGYTKLYIPFHQYPFWYLPFSLLTAMFLHETYYYWLHRWMHIPSVFKVLHKVHHDSNTTSAWTSFSFHPLEGFLQAMILPLTLFILPMNIYIVLFQLILMTFSSIINHLEVETYPRNFHKHFIGKWIIGATHHSLHHKQFKYNYGLYFTFWDKWKKTESPMFNKTFESVTTNKIIK